MLSTEMTEVASKYLNTLEDLQKRSIRIAKRLEARGEDVMALNAYVMAQGYAAQAFNINESYVRYIDDQKTPAHIKRQSILDALEEDADDDPNPFPSLDEQD